ncbi:hypothetical protein IMCC12053_186 [Celeribacter marinus]|uniref:Uncharacterized protein n=1 Tax=Celeribacter marinus TaxID=1397108 RepID=A0A0N9ZLL7_9RHOB|nr:hypothetical protein IMCC12053_186 [Celeribacter marinus]
MTTATLDPITHRFNKRMVTAFVCCNRVRLRGRGMGVFDFTQEAVFKDETQADLRFHPE